MSHCPPKTSTAQVSVPNASAVWLKKDEATGGAPGSGQVRGRVLMLPGIGGSSPTAINGIGGTVIGAFWDTEPTDGSSLRSALNSDGWQTVQTANIPQFNYAWESDVVADTAHGTRYVNANLLYFDHIMDFCRKNFGGTMPTVVMGMSYGAWWTCQVAINRLSGQYPIVAAYAHCPVNDFANSIILGPPTSALTTAYSGASLSTTALNSITVPMRVTWGLTDNFVTYSPPPVDCINMVSNASIATGGSVTNRTTVGSSVGTNIATYTGSGVFTPASTAGLATSGSVVVPVTGGTQTVGGTTFNYPTCVIAYTGISGGTLTGCTVQYAGTGTIAAGYVVGTSTTCSGGSVTGIGINEGHTLGSLDTTDATTWFTGTIDPLYPKAF